MPVIEAVPTPIAADAHGVFRVGGTRVTLDTVITAFKLGASAEGIVDQYPTLRLEDTYATLSYYLNNREQVESYLHEQEKLAGETRQKIEKRFPPDGLRSRILARRAGR